MTSDKGPAVLLLSNLLNVKASLERQWSFKKLVGIRIRCQVILKDLRKDEKDYILHLQGQVIQRIQVKSDKY